MSMKTRIRIALTLAALAAPLAAVLGTAAPASAEPRCEIRFRWNGNGSLSGTAWVDASTCGAKSRISIICASMVHSRRVKGNTVTTGTTKAYCDAVSGLEGVSGRGTELQYKVRGTWYSAPITRTGSHTIIHS
jgi:hypothetical protein